MSGLSPFHMLIIFLVVLIIFGPKSIPKIAQAFGKGIREFKEAARGLSTDIEDEAPHRTVVQTPPQAIPHDASTAQPHIEQAQGTPQQPGSTPQA